MAIQVDATGAPRILRLTIGESWPGLEEQRSWRQSMIESGQITAETRALIDVRSLTQLPKYEELQGILNGIMRDGGWPLQRAFLTSTVAQFGVARQLQLMAPPTISVEVFNDLNEAEAWLDA
jgi:hypothetical protein